METLTSLSIGTLLVIAAIGNVFKPVDTMGRDGQATALKLLQESRTLTKSEMAQVVAAAIGAIGGRTLRVVQEPGVHSQVVLDSRGHLRYLWTDTGGADVFEDHTIRPAVTCDGRPLIGNMYIEYGRIGPMQRWHVAAHLESSWHTMPRFWDIFDGPLISGGFTIISGRRARAIIGTVPPEQRFQPGLEQILWVDLQTLLPLRWALTVDRRSFGYELSLAHDPSLDLKPPTVPDVPTCLKEPAPWSP